MILEERIKKAIRDVPDFPKEGIIFKDITPILQDAQLCKDIVVDLSKKFLEMGIEGVAGIESRGFIFGQALAIEMNVPFIPIRKKGKLPYHVVSHAYDLEYGSAEIEMHTDAVSENQKILVHDDLLATGGTAAAAAELILMQGARVEAFNFIVDLTFLNGENAISKYSKNIITLARY
ncbi:MAG: adenine phosphoribosyltransferase [Flavobacteriales bacterium]|nr:adenine phosphoribosyltransferase [Flavobacteriales bacterium]